MIAIIPARKGSKRLIGKNIKTLNGKPLIEWTVNAAKSSQVFNKIVITTDDNKIIDLYANNKDLSLDIRPDYLSDDKATTIDVIKHVLKQNSEETSFALLQPTSPLRSEYDIREAYRHFISGYYSSVISVCKNNKNNIDYNLYKLMEKKIIPIIDNINIDTDKYCLNGAIFMSKNINVQLKNSIYQKDSYFFEMPIQRSIDIDTIDDFNIAKDYLANKLDY